MMSYVTRFFNTGINPVSDRPDLSQSEQDEIIRKLNADNTIVMMINSIMFTALVCFVAFILYYVWSLIAIATIAAGIYYLDDLLKFNYYHCYYGSMYQLGTPDKTNKAKTDSMVNALYRYQYRQIANEFRSDRN